jgi:hypothetical protein
MVMAYFGYNVAVGVIAYANTVNHQLSHSHLKEISVMGRPSNRSKRQSEAMKRYWARWRLNKGVKAGTTSPRKSEPPKRVLKAMETLRVYLLSA